MACRSNVEGSVGKVKPCRVGLILASIRLIRHVFHAERHREPDQTRRPERPVVRGNLCCASVGLTLGAQASLDDHIAGFDRASMKNFTQSADKIKKDNKL